MRHKRLLTYYWIQEHNTFYYASKTLSFKLLLVSFLKEKHMDNIEVSNIFPRKKSLLFWFKYYGKSVPTTLSPWFKILNLENKKVSQYEFTFYVFVKSLF